MYNNLKQAFARIWLPTIVLITYLFLYIPIIILVVFSFNNAPFPAPWKEFSTRWYEELWDSRDLWDAFYNSLTVALSTTFLSLTMAITIMYYQTYNSKIKNFMFLFYGNLIIPEIFLAIGLLSFLSFLFIPLGIPTLIIGHTLLGLGYVVPIVYTRFSELDYRLTEASLDLGATHSQTFFKITLPLLVPSLVAAGLLVFIISFDDFLLSFFCAGNSAQTLSLYIFGMIRSGASPIINALSTFLLALSSLLVIIFCWLNVKTRIF